MGILIKTFLTVKSGEYSDISDFDDSDEMLVKASQDAETNSADSGEQKTTDKWYDDALVGVHPLEQTVAKLALADNTLRCLMNYYRDGGDCKAGIIHRPLTNMTFKESRKLTRGRD
uniref:Uncharacterized protein n=1 Tax=Magallana gigas TaxID=29159 RepID=K1QAG2_MAGGI